MKRSRDRILTTHAGSLARPDDLRRWSRAVSSDETVLGLAGVSKLFGSTPAVDGASLEIRRGEVFTLLGPSGCGKTTTLRLVAGLERPDAGEITLRGRVVASSRAGRVRGAAQAQPRDGLPVVRDLAPHDRVRQRRLPAHAARQRAARSSSDKVTRVLDLVGLDGLQTRAATLLSGGQMQRLALCRALVYEPDLLLLDEPFSNLDAKLREQMRVELKLLQRRLGVTVLFVTHDQIEALSLSDRIAVMQRGRVEQVGTPRGLYDHPASAFVRDFLGQTVVLRGRIAGREAGVVTVKMDGALAGRILAGRAAAEASLEDGAGVQLAIRPEDIVVSRGREPRGPTITRCPA